MGKIGIFAGTFDPVHHGHIAFALAAAEHEQLEKVILLPERHPRNKVGITPFDDRLAMLELAARDYRNVEVLALPEDRFSVARTLPELHRRYGAQLVLLIGSDVVPSLARWNDLAVLLSSVEFLVALRHGDEETVISKELYKLGARFTCMPSPHQRLASSHIRQLPVITDIHPDVQAYITSNRLYSVAN